MAVFLMWLTFSALFALFLPLEKDVPLMPQLLNAVKLSCLATVAALAGHFFFMFKKGTSLGNCSLRDLDW